MSEAEILRDILLTLGSRPDIRVWRNQVGLFRQGPRTVRVGIVGQSDVFGILSDGRFLCLEVKKPGGRVSPEQHAWIATVKKFGGVAAVVYSVDDALKIIETSI